MNKAERMIRTVQSVVRKNVNRTVQRAAVSSSWVVQFVEPDSTYVADFLSNYTKLLRTLREIQNPLNFDSACRLRI
jgi:hypothetical protein